MSRQQYARKHGVNRTQDMAKQTFAHLSSGVAIKDFSGKPILGDDMSLKSFGMSERSGYAQSHTVFNEPEVHGVSQRK